MTTIGITGTIGAGKGIIVEYLKTKGFKHYEARAMLLKEVKKRGLAPIRDNIALVGNDLRKTHFPGYIISELLAHAKLGGGDAVIESIRSDGELNLLRKHAENFYLFSVDADPEIRYERITQRGSSTDHVDYEKFLEDEQKEFESAEAWGMNIKSCMEKADFKFENNGSIEELLLEVDEVLKKIQK